MDNDVCEEMWADDCGCYSSQILSRNALLFIEEWLEKCFIFFREGVRGAAMLRTGLINESIVVHRNNRSAGPFPKFLVASLADRSFVCEHLWAGSLSTTLLSTQTIQ